MFSCCHRRDSSLSSLLEYTRVRVSVGAIDVVQVALRSPRVVLPWSHVSVLGAIRGGDSSILRSVRRALLLSCQRFVNVVKMFSFGNQLICHPAMARNFCNYL